MNSVHNDGYLQFMRVEQSYYSIASESYPISLFLGGLVFPNAALCLPPLFDTEHSNAEDVVFQLDIHTPACQRVIFKPHELCFNLPPTTKVLVGRFVFPRDAQSTPHLITLSPVPAREVLGFLETRGYCAHSHHPLTPEKPLPAFPLGGPRKTRQPRAEPVVRKRAPRRDRDKAARSPATTPSAHVVVLSAPQAQAALTEATQMLAVQDDGAKRARIVVDDDDEPSSSEDDDPAPRLLHTHYSATAPTTMVTSTSTTPRSARLRSQGSVKPAPAPAPKAKTPKKIRRTGPAEGVEDISLLPPLPAVPIPEGDPGDVGIPTRKLPGFDFPHQCVIAPNGRRYNILWQKKKASSEQNPWCLLDTGRFCPGFECPSRGLSYIYTIGYKFASMHTCLNAEHNKEGMRCPFLSSIVSDGGKPLFRVIPFCAPHLVFESRSPSGAWTQVVIESNKLHSHRQTSTIRGQQYFGLVEPEVKQRLNEVARAYVREATTEPKRNARGKDNAKTKGKKPRAKKTGTAKGRLKKG